MHITQRTPLALAVALALLPAVAGAQQPQEQADPAQPDATELDTIVVSGAAQAGGLRKRDASYSITTATLEQVQEAAPKSTADLLKIVPGVWAESAGGTTGANIDVRGFPGGSDAPFITVQLDGSPLYPPPTVSFLENSSLFRIDDTVETVEVLRGGPSPIFGNGQPGATINFIQKKGGLAPEGSLRLTTGSGSQRRVDGFYGAPINDQWSYSVGGFWRSTDGIRDTQFPADEGGQLSATLTRWFDNGELTLYGRMLDDKNAFFTAVPLISRDGGRDVDAFPGFDPGSDTLLGGDFRHVDIEVGPGETIRRDLAEGRGADVDLFGAILDLDFGGWRLSHRSNYLSGDAPTNGLFTGANPQTLGSWLEDAIEDANDDPAVVAAAGGPASSASASFVNGGGAVDPDQQVLTAGWWVVDKALDSFTSETRLSFDLAPGHTLTGGAYYANYSSHDRWYLGNEMLLTVEPNARRIDVALDNGVAVTRDGFAGAPFFALDARYDGENLAGFLAHEWQINEVLRFDAGMRYEEQKVDALISNAVAADYDGDPTTLYNNGASLRDGSYRSLRYDNDEVSWTAGLNWRMSDAASVFARVNSGFFFPQFDNLRDGQDNTQQVDQYEIGLKSGNELFDLYLTAFYNEFEGLPFQLFLPDGTNVTAIGDSRAHGLEFEGALRPFDNFEVALTGNWVEAEYRNFGDNTGNEVRRQPSLQYRVTPSYFLPAGWADLKLYATYTYVGRRYSDPENQQRIPSYQTVDAGVAAYVGDNWEFRLSGSNLTDEIGLTEANARIVGDAVTGDVFLGRPIFGRAWEFSAAYRF
ncbi:TonB-dependent receptor [Luteimonas sp. RD2P54]|uniref:TonB-dependent receptor n=1 Tax=Luteimonas endophytica TaxID=3042023 RepID=A0ABT6JD95_9GAMM|nr:TonB-dependent receptor [Luteimonas endophytica]MDH5824793.1 TonB-dependent receptor [Luteimonas endophytica]